VAGEIEAEAARTLTSGRDYLQSKKRLLDESVAPPRATVRAVNKALASLGKAAAKTRRELFPPPGKGRPYVIGASFLVNAKHRGAWKTRVGKAVTELAREGHRLEVSGPWPPYHFVSK
jgi:Gas vesicle synthesis protein GvpL/GvpF